MRFVLLLLFIALFTKDFERKKPIVSQVECNDGLTFEIIEKGAFYLELSEKHDIGNIKDGVNLSHVLFLINRAKYYQVPERIAVRWINRESRFDSLALSYKGAFGYAQIMPDTWQELSCKLQIGHSPTNNIEAGLFYLREQYDRFGSWELALAAYNSGPNRKCLYQGRIPRIEETQKYVKYIMN